MFDDGNPAVTRAARGRGAGRRSFRLWSWPKTPKVAMDDALCGFWAADWLAIGYALLLLTPTLTYGIAHPLAFRREPQLMPHPPALISLVLVVAAMGLEQVIRRWQARWAAGVLLLWTLLEAARSALPWLRHDIDLALAPNLVCLLLALRGMAGSIVLARLRKQAPVEVFS